MIGGLGRLIPHLGAISTREKIRASVGALIGILLTGFVTRLAVGSGSALPMLIAPMGASAVLLFAVPTSPLAQPWSILAGNTVAAVIGVTCANLIPDPVAAAALACGLAIAAMLVTRCLHPPSGAVALTAVLGGPVVHAAGYGFVLWPVGLNSVLLLATALAFNNLTGRRYPHLSHPAPQPALPTAARHAFTAEDLRAVLRERDEIVDVDPDDIRDVVDAAEARAYGRRFGELTCRDVMWANPLAVLENTPLAEVRRIMVANEAGVLTVTTSSGALVGIVSERDLVRCARWVVDEPSDDSRARRSAGRSEGLRFEAKTARDALGTTVPSVRPETRLADVVPTMVQRDLRCVPVTGPDDRCLGIVTQTDLIAALFSGTDRKQAADQPRVSIQS